MSLKITYDGVKGLFILKPKGLPAVTTKSILDISPVIAHYFCMDTHHDIFKRKGLCLLCEAIREESEERKKDA